jgi:hypothetical protein
MVATGLAPHLKPSSSTSKRTSGKSSVSECSYFTSCNPDNFMVVDKGGVAQRRWEQGVLPGTGRPDHEPCYTNPHIE